MVGALLSRASAASGVKGKQVRILCELVTVIEESVAKMSLGNWEDGYARRSFSQETCRSLVHGAIPPQAARKLVVPKHAAAAAHLCCV